MRLCSNRTEPSEGLAHLEDALAQSRVMAPVEITEDYYAILEVSQTASSDTIRKSYRRLAVLLHPDKNPNRPDATAAFQLVSLAPATFYKIIH